MWMCISVITGRVRYMSFAHFRAAGAAPTDPDQRSREQYSSGQITSATFSPLRYTKSIDMQYISDIGAHHCTASVVWHASQDVRAGQLIL